MNQKRFTAIYQLYFDSLLSFANNHINDSYLAEDIVQDLFLSLWEQNFSEAVCIEQFLFSSLYSRITDYLRQDFQNTSCFHDFSDYSKNPIPSVLQLLYRNQNFFFLKEQLYDRMAQLPKEEQTILSLFYTEGKNAKEIATILSLKHATVRKRLERSKFRLRQQFLYFS